MVDLVGEKKNYCKSMYYTVFVYEFPIKNQQGIKFIFVFWSAKEPPWVSEISLYLRHLYVSRNDQTNAELRKFARVACLLWSNNVSRFLQKTTHSIL